MFPGEPSVAVKQMWIFKFFGKVSNEVFWRLGVNRKRGKTGPARDVHQYDPQAATPSFILIFRRDCGISSGRQQWMATDIVFPRK